MKYIKSYETVDFAKIKRGYYIILHSIHSELNDFVSHNIGKIVGKSNTRYNVVVEYDSVPKEIERFFGSSKQPPDQFGIQKVKYTREFPNHSITHAAKNIKDLEQLIMNTKFNI